VYITTPDINAPPIAADQGLIISVSSVSFETLLGGGISKGRTITSKTSKAWNINDLRRPRRACVVVPVLRKAHPADASGDNPAQQCHVTAM
jgi:hypothetical protein